MKFNKKSFEILIVPVIFAALVIYFFKNAVFSNNIFIERDLSRYYYPLREFAVNCVKSGTFPLWNPYVFYGNPIFASLQSSILYPLSIIYYLGDFARMFNAFIFVHFFLAGLFTYILLRQMRYSFFAGILSAIAFSYSGYLLSMINLLTTLSVIIWLPLAILFYYRMIKAVSINKKGFFDAAMLGIILTVMFLGGEPSVLYAVIGLFAAGSVYFFVEEALNRKFNFYYFKSMILAIVVFLGLSAFQFLPFVEFLRISNRENLNFLIVSTWNMPLKDTPSVILPFFHDIFRLFANYWNRQSWLDNYYVGILVFILFIIGIFFDKSKKARAIFIFGLLGFILSLGKNTIFFELLYKFLPGFKVIRYSVRFFFIPTFAICVLAGMGLDYYAKFIKTNKNLKKAAFFVLVLAFSSSVAFLILHLYFSWCLNFAKMIAVNFVYHSDIPRLLADETVKTPTFLRFIIIDLINLKRILLLLSFFGILFFLGSQKGVRANIFIVPWLVFLAVTDVMLVNGGYYPLFSAKQFQAPTPNVEYLLNESQKMKKLYPDDLNKQLFRICCSPQTAREHAYVPEADFFKGLEASKDRLITDRMVEFGIYDINIYGSIYIKRNSRFTSLIMSKKSKNLDKLLKLSNVKFIASSNDYKINGYKLANKNNIANLYQADDYLERAFLVENAVVIKNEDDIVTKLKDGDFQPAKEVIIEDYLSVKPVVTPNLKSKKVGAISDKVRIVSYKPNRVIIETEIFNKPKFLVLTDTYFPGWKVSVDGKTGRILRADYIFRAVYLNPGRHKVEFIFTPFSFRLGVIISLLTGAIILTFMTYYNIIIWLINKKHIKRFFKTKK